MSAGLCSFWRFKGRIHILTFSASRGCLHSWLVGPSLHHSSLLLPTLYLPLLTLTLLLLSIKTFVIILDILRKSRIFSPSEVNHLLRLITPVKSLLPCKVTYSQVPGIRTWTSLGVITQPTVNILMAFWLCRKLSLILEGILNYLGVKCHDVCELLLNTSARKRRNCDKNILFIYLFLAALGLCCCTRAFSSCGERGLLFVVVHGLLNVVASLAAERGL